jgi:rare lipoprotein A
MSAGFGARAAALAALWLAATAVVAGCSTSRFIVETGRALQDVGAPGPSASDFASLQPATARHLAPVQVQEGDAVWYGANAHGNRTASGEVFDMNGLTAAHNSFPFQSLVRVTNLRNGRQVILRITDRGGFREPRIIDVSVRAAELLGFKSAGVAPVRLELLAPGVNAAGGGVAAR